ncbi:hypothetical protein BD560DRAFT_427570 [Blakeslea trispora]|nr:hypothetical protein BD560DRAFT_427570 [Blakeslea trispora]
MQSIVSTFLECAFRKLSLAMRTMISLHFTIRGLFSTMQQQEIGRLFLGAVVEEKFHLNCFSLCIIPCIPLIPKMNPLKKKPVLEDNQRDFPQNADMSDTEAAISTRSSPRLQELNSVSRSGLYIGSDNESLAEELRFLYEPEAQEIEDNSNSSIVTDRISVASALKGISIQGDCSSVSASSMSDTQESFGEGPSFHS